MVELTGSPASNTTGDIEDALPSSASSSSSGATVQAVDSDASVVVGTGRNLYCFQNSPYDCEAYFGQATLALTGSLRCSACQGDPFTGIGSPGGVPTPAPVASDDDDGLSKMGQERAQGGTPSPTPVGGLRSGSDNDAGGGDPELFGVTGKMRYVVLGLVVGLGGAVLVCMCLVTVCRASRKGQRERGEEEIARSASVAPRFSSNDNSVAGFSATGDQWAWAGSSQSKPSENNQLFNLSPGASSVTRGRTADSHPGARRISVLSSTSTATPLSQRKSREYARQRVMQMSLEADQSAEERYRQSPGSGWENSWSGMAVTDTASRGGFTALPGTQQQHEHQQEKAREPELRDTMRRVGSGLRRREEPTRGSRRPAISRRDGSGMAGSGGGGANDGPGRHRNKRSGEFISPESSTMSGGRKALPPSKLSFEAEDLGRTRAVRTPAGGARMPIKGARPAGAAEAAASSAPLPRQARESINSLSDMPDWAADTAEPSARKNPVYSHSGASVSPTRAEMPGAGRSSGRASLGRPVSPGTERSREQEEDLGWGAELYRSTSLSATKKTSGKVSSGDGGFDATRSDWSLGGNVGV